MKHRPLFWSQLLFTLLICSFLILPIILSALAGITVNFFVGLKSGLTLKWIIEVWQLYADTIQLSLLLAIACLGVTLILGVPMGYVLARQGGRIARLIEETITLPIAIPGMAIALALIITYGGFREFRMSWAFILVGHVLYTLPFMVRSVLAVLSAINFKELEEGAASLGAPFLTRFVTIILPNCKQGILAGSLMVITLSVGEFNLTWMLHTPLTKTLPVGLADAYASMRLEIASAYTLIFLIMILPLLTAMQAFSGYRPATSQNSQLQRHDHG